METQNTATKKSTFATQISQVLFEKKQAFIISPVSIYAALRLLELGCDKLTRKELETFFGDAIDFKKYQDFYEKFNDKTIQLSNTIITKSALDPNFHKAASNFALVEKDDSVDPVVLAKKICDYVEKHTGGLIKDIVSPTDVSSLQLAIINAMRIKINWFHDYSSAGKKSFTSFDNSSKQMEFMKKTTQIKFYEDDDLTVVVDKFKTDDYEYHFCLPKNDFAKTANLFMGTDYPLTTKLLNIVLPKFEQESKFDLVEIFKSVGVKNIFSSSADFSKMVTKSEGLFVDKIIHQSNLIVDETGIEGGAATAVMMMKSLMQPKTIAFDKPFIGKIVHVPSGMIIFVHVFN